ncbi:hypothetical protein FXO38_30900 [Capsicum annuum]|nr:hypothetical protein FXO38_30900 [Capsicum annuum]
MTFQSDKQRLINRPWPLESIGDSLGGAYVNIGDSLGGAYVNTGDSLGGAYVIIDDVMGGAYIGVFRASMVRNARHGQALVRVVTRRFSEQNPDAPPSYEEANGMRKHLPCCSVPATRKTHGRGIPSARSAPKSSSPHAIESPNQANTTASLSTPVPAAAPPENKDIESFDEFEPRVSFSGK